MATTDLWTYRDDALVGNALVGLEVVATDGEIGKVDEAAEDAGTSGIVVDTGTWIFGKKVMLPAGVIDRVDLDEEKVYVNRTKDEIKNAPEYDDSKGADEDYRAKLGAYYGGRDDRAGV
jgi:hypothetical protein